MMYLYYTNKALLAVIFPFLYSGICYVLVSGLTPMTVLVQLASLNVVFLAISRVSIIAFLISMQFYLTKVIYY